MLFFFVDGIGIGTATDNNPFYKSQSKYLPLYQTGLHLPDSTTQIKPIDTSLGVPGIPQSASSQTSLFTGVNIPQLFQKHFDSFPPSQMRKIIMQQNLLLQLKKLGFSAIFINAYPFVAQYFSANHITIDQEGRFCFSTDFPKGYKNRISVTSCMILSTGQKPFDEHDIVEKKALYQDFSNTILIQKNLILPVFSPRQAAEIMAHALKQYDFVLYEFFQTDIFGHGRTFDEQVYLISQLDELLKELLLLLDPYTDTLLLTSDHGNLEDATTQSHTLNPVPLLLYGNEADTLRTHINSIVDVTPNILTFFQKNE